MPALNDPMSNDPSHRPGHVTRAGAPHCAGIALASLLFAGLAAAATAPAEIRVGRAKTVITPPVGSVVGNSYGITVARGVTSDLHARAMVLEQNGVRAAWVTCDLISLHRPILERTRRLIAERTGIPQENVIVSATHCHAGPQTHPLFLAAVGGDAQRRSERYVETLPGLIAESVRLAEADLQPARVFAGRAREEGLAFNRRFLLRDGTVDTNPGRRNPNAVRPMGPVDPEVGIVYIESVDRRPLVTWVNFALHVAVAGAGGRGLVSADYPHTVAELLGRVKGEQMLTIFATGMSGNVNHNNVALATQAGGEAEAARIGTVLAAAVLKALPHLQPVGAVPLQVVTRAVRAPARPAGSPEEVEQARRTILRHGKGATFPEVIQAWRLLDVSTYAKDGDWPGEVQAITLGRDLALVGYPGDSFVELGLHIKGNSPFRWTFVSEQSGSGSLGYVPNEKAYPEGSYEVESARLAPGGGEVLAVAAVRMLTEMFPRPGGVAAPSQASSQPGR